MSIVENYKNIQEIINATAKRCGRNPDEISLVVVTKGHQLTEFEPLFSLGQQDFGESRIQEALPKIESCTNRDIKWHFIGSLQKNKVRKVLETFDGIHSIDSLELAQKISEVAAENGEIPHILLQINTSGEPSKRGMSPQECRKYFPKLIELPSLQIEGLMTMAPLIDDGNIIRRCFADLRLLRDSLREEFNYSGLKQLSMGMSHDYKLAIEEGATLLRIGSEIFKAAD